MATLSVPARLVVVLAALLAGAPVPAADRAPAAARVERFIEEVSSFRAGFEQRVYDGSGELIEESSGHVVMQRPGRFRWDYERPFERTIVADGERVWLYEADLDQVTIRRLGDSLGDTPAAILTGRESVLERFRIEAARSERGLERVRLVPNSADSDFSAVELGFAGDDLRELRLEDRLGQVTEVRFATAEVNPALDPELFRFSVPPGVDVIDDAEL